MLPLLQIPQHGYTIFPARCAQRPVRGNGDSIEISRMLLQISAKLAVGQVPYLDKLIPATGHDERVLGRGREAYAGDPLGMAVIMNGEFTFAKGVPELNGTITGSGHDLTVVSRESDGKDILSVADEATGGVAGAKIPETKGMIPGGGEGKLAVGREDDVRDEMAMTSEGTLGIAVGSLLLCIGGELPNDDSFIARGGEDGVGVVDGGGKRGDPAGMTFEVATKGESFCHGDG